MRIIGFLISIIVIIVVFIVGMRLLFPLPDATDVAESSYVQSSEATMMGQAKARGEAEHPGLSGVRPLADGPEALAARVLLARNAEESIDAQYYIWQEDTTSWLLLDELRQAAERGVRVRLLLDDNGIPGLDEELAALNAMENFEVRLYNPFTLRNPKLLSYVFDFSRLNHRMHNKAMIADGAVSIIGGRNIGDIYFEFGDGAHYFDFDTVAIGPATDAVSANFDDYWNSASAYPAELILDEPTPEGLESVKAEGQAARETVDGSAYLKLVQNSDMMAELGTPDFFEWTNVELITDDPVKTLREAEGDELMINKLARILADADTSVDLVSAYFIPADKGTELLSSLAERGVNTRVLTNSLESNDVSSVHSAYMKYRPKLVENGVIVLELTAEAAGAHTDKLPTVLGSTSSLHAKSFAIDGDEVFIGSFNFDPRSAQLNTEMGLLIESPTIAAGISSALEDPSRFYRVRDIDIGQIDWEHVNREGAEKLFVTEPNVPWTKRAIVTFMSWLPIEWML
ncbi:phospholipase D family protein [Pseudooceanicola sp. LIPI14-2-Ac024]|uniref:phospholipase D family protein n=1 Tax=Pseudooceanicola sp. LIPI14-2-Ac024 TaxID=3344875 RepID=UPI0035D13216